MKMTPEDLNNPEVMFPGMKKPEHVCGAADFVYAVETRDAVCPACELHENKYKSRREIELNHSTAIEVLQNPPTLENPETAWVDDNGHALPDIQVDPLFVAEVEKEEEDIRRHNEYILLCHRGDVKPMGYHEWLEFDKKYQEHLRTAASPLSSPTFQRLSQVETEDWKVKYDLAQKSISDYVSELKTVCSQRDELQSRLDCLLSNVHSAGDRINTLEEHVKVVDAENKRLSELNADLDEENSSLLSAMNEQQFPVTPSNQPLFPHYFRAVPNASHVDVYWVLKAWDVTDPCVQHAIKKLMAAGMRGAKDKMKDLKEARDSITRALELEETK